jgi:hypothetical protein
MSAPFTLRMPPSWWQFDVWRATRTADLARHVDARIAAQPSLRPRRGALLRALREAAADAERRGALTCAVMGEQVDDAGLLTAVMAVVQTPGAADPESNTPEAIAGRLTVTAPRTGSPRWRRVTVLDLPAGRAVRVWGVEPVTAGTRTADCVVMHTLVPLPDGRGLLDVVFTSPQTHLAEPMLDLFDAITGTLSWSSPRTTAGSATTPTPPEGN